MLCDKGLDVWPGQACQVSISCVNSIAYGLSPRSCKKVDLQWLLIIDALPALVYLWSICFLLSILCEPVENKVINCGSCLPGMHVQWGGNFYMASLQCAFCSDCWVISALDPQRQTDQGELQSGSNIESRMLPAVGRNGRGRRLHAHTGTSPHPITHVAPTG
jgi:hypothetical protein